MIARWWRGWTASAEDAVAYEELLKTTILPWVGSHEGHRGSYLVRRDVDGEVEFATLTLWDSLDSIRAFAGEDYDNPRLVPAAEVKSWFEMLAPGSNSTLGRVSDLWDRLDDAPDRLREVRTMASWVSRYEK